MSRTFLRRWSRLKRQAAISPEPPAPAAELPPLETLSMDSDFGAFMRGKVEEKVRRAALKKLFSDPHFNVMDGLDIYVGDYSQEDPIPQAMLEQLEHARATLFSPAAEEAAKQPPPEGNGAPAEIIASTPEQSAEKPEQFVETT
jgi:hypothetical protein